MVPRRMRIVVTIAIGLIALAGRANATAITVCAAPSGVVISADSKATAISDGRSLAPVTKIVPVGSRTVISVAGLAAWPPLHYEFHKWIRRIASKLHPDPSPAGVADAVASAAESLFQEHAEAISSAGKATYFVVAGLDDDGPAVWEVGLLPSGRQVHAVKQRKFGSNINDPQVFSWGFLDSFGFGSTQGPLWQEVRRRAPPWLMRALPRMNVYQRASFCGLPIAVAVEHSSSYGLPIKQVLISPDVGILARDWKPPPSTETNTP